MWGSLRRKKCMPIPALPSMSDGFGPAVGLSLFPPSRERSASLRRVRDLPQAVPAVDAVVVAIGPVDLQSIATDAAMSG